MPLAAAAEVRRSDGKIVMEEADYRFFITKIETLSTENEALKRVLAVELRRVCIECPGRAGGAG